MVAKITPKVVLVSGTTLSSRADPRGTRTTDRPVINAALPAATVISPMVWVAYARNKVIPVITAPLKRSAPRNPARAPVTPSVASAAKPLPLLAALSPLLLMAALLDVAAPSGACSEACEQKLAWRALRSSSPPPGTIDRARLRQTLLRTNHNNKVALPMANLTAKKVKGFMDSVASFTMTNVVPQITVMRSNSKSATSCCIHPTPFQTYSNSRPVCDLSTHKPL